MRPSLLLLAALIAAPGREPVSLQAPALAASSGVEPEIVHVFLVGDVMLGNAGQTTLEQLGYDHPFRAVRPLFQDADVVVGNLEGPITERTEPLRRTKEYLYKCRPACGPALREFGFDLFSLANNHALDYRQGGLEDTIAALEAAGMRHFGAGRSQAEATAERIVERAGVRIGMLGFMAPYGAYAAGSDYFAHGGSGGVAELSEDALRAAVARARPRVDVLIGCFHWGENYAPVTAEQRALGRLAAELGFDLVFGHHPHVAQGVEVHRGVPILYSLGNFTFCAKGRFEEVEDARWRHGWIADVWIAEKRVRRVDLIPIDVDNRLVRYQPRPSAPSVLPGMLALLNAELGAPLQIAGDRLRLELAD